jgi:DNA-binding beta-propeller fold protein YncE
MEIMMNTAVKRMMLNISAGLGLSVAMFAQGYKISTVAGSVKSNNGDGVLASSAPLLNPQQIAVDSSGNIYIADGDAHRVRMISSLQGVPSVPPGTASAGTMTTIAGQGRNVGSGDTTTVAVNTPLNDPTGVALDPTGKILYIAERDNHKIKRLDLTTGTISTLAGYGGNAGWAGDGDAPLCPDGKTVCGALYARLRNPQQLAVDSVGNLYVADRGNNRIRKICIASPVKSTDCVTGTISTVAGIGPSNGDPLYTVQSAGDGGPATKAQLARAEGVAVDSAGNVFIADTNNNKIRRVDASTGIITTVAGSCLQGAPISTNSGGAPLNGTFILPTSSTWPTCTATTEGTAAAPGGTPTFNTKNLLVTFLDGNLAVNSTLNRPRSLAFDSTGNLYIADTSTNRIRVIYASSGTINSSSIINTVAGSGTSSGFSGDGGRAIQAVLSSPRGVAVGTNGFYFTDQTQGQISSSSAGGRLRFVDAVTTNINTVTTNQYFGDGGTGANAMFNDPRGLAVDPVGNVYIADANNNRLRKLAPNGALNSIAGTGAAAFSGDTGAALFAKVNNPTCSAVDSAGNLYLADRANNRIRKIDTLGNINTVAGGGALNTATDGILAVNAVLSGPRCVAVDSQGNLYIADTGNNTVRKVDTTGLITTLAGVWAPSSIAPSGTFVGLCAPGSLTINASGLFFYLNCNSPGADGGPGTSAYLNSPQGIAVDPAGKFLYIADASYSTVRKLDLTSGIITTLIGDANDGGSNSVALGPTGSIGPDQLVLLNTPIGVAADAAGNVYIADSNNYRVVKVDVNGFASIIAGRSSTCATGQTPAANLCSPASFAWGDNTDATAVALTMPRGIAVDGSGNVYITEALGLIRKLSPPSTATTTTTADTTSGN